MNNIITAVKNLAEKIKQNKYYIWADENHLPMLFAIFGLAFFLRLWQIDVIPGGFSEKERLIVDLIQKINLRHLWLGEYYFYGSYIYSGFVWTKIFGLTVLNLRILSALVGSLTVVYSYIFISKWFSRKIAIFTAFLFAISSFHITISRLILPEIFLPLVLLILFATLTDAYRTKNPWLFGISGILIGLGLYTSPAFIFVPILFAVAGAYFYLKNKKFFSSYKYEIGIALIGFVAAALPFIAHFEALPKAYLTNFGFNRSLWQIIMNIGQIPTILFSGTDKNFFLNIGSEPLFDPFIFVTSVIGFLFALFSISRRKYFFLIFWLLFFALYAALKRGVQIVDLIGVMPVFYAFSALILDYVLTKWFETFPLNKRARLAVVALVSIFFTLSALYNFDRYFLAYKNSGEVRGEFSAKAPIPLK